MLLNHCRNKYFQKPFTFGLLDEMLPKPAREAFGSPQPYSYYPSHVFELPFSLKHQGAMLDSPKSQTYTEYTVESFDSAARKSISCEIKMITVQFTLCGTQSHQLTLWYTDCVVKITQ